MRHVVRILLNLIHVCKRFVLKLWAIEIAFLQVRGNNLENMFLGKLLKQSQDSERFVYAKFE